MNKRIVFLLLAASWVFSTTTNAQRRWEQHPGCYPQPSLPYTLISYHRTDDYPLVADNAFFASEQTWTSGITDSTIEPWMKHGFHTVFPSGGQVGTNGVNEVDFYPSTSQIFSSLGVLAVTDHNYTSGLLYDESDIVVNAAFHTNQGGTSMSDSFDYSMTELNGTLSAPSGTYHYQSVLAHEVGHTMGLDDFGTFSDNVMKPSLGDREIKVQITNSDQSQMQQRYCDKTPANPGASGGCKVGLTVAASRVQLGQLRALAILT
jgi:hypothetical protein